MTTTDIAKQFSRSSERIRKAIVSLRLEERGLAEKHGPVWWVLPNGVEEIRQRLGKVGRPPQTTNND